MMKWKTVYFKAAIITSSILFIISILYLLINKIYFPSPPYYIPLNQETNTILSVIILICILPIAFTQYINDIWLDSVDHNVPRFLQDVTEDVKSGQSLLKSLKENAKEDYGSLNNPLRKSIIRFKFTSDLKNSLSQLGDELKRPSAKQMSSILIESYSAGGKVGDILHNSVSLFKSIDIHKQNRRIKTKPYLVVVYVSLAIFLVISWVILNRFLIPMNNQTQIISTNTTYIVNLLEINYYKSILFWSAIIESSIGGLVAGKISNGKISSGLIHSVFLIFVSIIFFGYIM